MVFIHRIILIVMIIINDFTKLTPDSESAPPRYNFYQFLDSFEFFALNLGKLPNYTQYFGSNNVEGVAESLVEVKLG